MLFPLLAAQGKEQLVPSFFKINARSDGIIRHGFFYEARDLQVTLDFLNTCFRMALCFASREQLVALEGQLL